MSNERTNIKWPIPTARNAIAFRQKHYISSHEILMVVLYTRSQNPGISVIDSTASAVRSSNVTHLQQRILRNWRQRRATRYVRNDDGRTRLGVFGLTEGFRWESLENRRKTAHLSLFYRAYHNHTDRYSTRFLSTTNT